ncbi:HupE/UreJ family protein [Devosia sp. MC532]|uniref:HupE/UreJ family protein n=1 Tax=Devosia sp. MC532 TaxID=2799788 RepID=UPI0018F51F30|nr:HupE/UreJ family protein [Devosia sp. MC532]MBJ7579354.1 HupE/UreJ family protein [Devosia sp. MC532]
MKVPALFMLLFSFAFVGPAWAHGVAGGDAAFLEASRGVDIGPYLYLGAKHMFTGYDHLLFLLGVLFYVFRMKDVVIYITLFSLGHSATLLLGVLTGLHLDAYLVDAVIGLSVVYKALDNLGGVQKLLGFVPNQRAIVLAFGLVHGFGLATKLQDINLSPDGLIANMVAFNVGVELGQFSALAFILTALALWRAQPSFSRQAAFINVLIMAAGFALTAIQLIGFWRQV